MGVPPVYRRKSERVITTFDFFDLANGLGYVDFFCFQTTDSTGDNDNIINRTQKTSNTFTKEGTGVVAHEFPMTFNITQVIKGKIFIQFHWGFSSNGNSSTLAASATILKNDVSIGTITGEDLTSTGDATRVEIFEIDVSKTQFNKNDTFKLKISWDGTGEALDNDNTFLLHDPSDSSVTPSGFAAQTDSVLKLSIPFEVSN